jgi:hypothetical protein
VQLCGDGARGRRVCRCSGARVPARWPLGTGLSTRAPTRAPTRARSHARKDGCVEARVPIRTGGRMYGAVERSDAVRACDHAGVRLGTTGLPRFALSDCERVSLEEYCAQRAAHLQPQRNVHRAPCSMKWKHPSCNVQHAAHTM